MAAVLPTPALSKTTTLWPAARASTNDADQLSMVPPKPMMSSSAGPLPSSRYPTSPSSVTATRTGTARTFGPGAACGVVALGAAAEAKATAGPGREETASVNTPAAAKPTAAGQAKAHRAAQDFEAVFLNSMFQHMFTGIDGEGPFGGQGATGVWRSVLTDQYAKSVAKAGGIGIAAQVYRSMMAHQEIKQ